MHYTKHNLQRSLQTYKNEIIYNTTMSEYLSYGMMILLLSVDNYGV